MPILSTSQSVSSTRNNGQSFVVPLILVTSLFFLWGLAYGLLDVLNKHFQDALNITKQRSTLLQAAYFGAYFLMAIPAGLFMSKVGYKSGIIAGLILYAIGAFLFFPSASMASFPFFLVSLFILASGLTFLETAANPYVTVLGNQDSSAFRLNLSQSFNGVGAFVGPIIGAQFFFSDSNSSELDSVKFVYIVIGLIVLIIAFMFFRTPLPEIREEGVEEKPALSRKLFDHTHFKWAVVAQFFYVAAQVGTAALFINYCTEADSTMTDEHASYLLSGSLLLFTIGRFAGTAFMKFVAPQSLLAVYGLVNVGLCAIVAFVPGVFGIYSLMAVFFFNSIMFPTIFALGVKDLGEHTKTGASFIIMSIVGGAIVPFVMASFTSTAISYVVPMVCFAVVFFFGFSGYKVRTSEAK